MCLCVCVCVEWDEEVRGGGQHWPPMKELDGYVYGSLPAWPTYQTRTHTHTHTHTTPHYISKTCSLANFINNKLIFTFSLFVALMNLLYQTFILKKQALLLSGLNMLNIYT